MQPPPGADPEGIVLTFPVAREFAGQRLDRFIQSRIPRLSRTRAQEIVRGSAFRADGGRRRPSDRVREGEIVMLVRPRLIEPETPLTFEIVYEDAEVLAIHKPAGLPMHPTATYHRHTLTYLLREQYGDAMPQIAHRLDKETSGIVLCGKTKDSSRELKMSFERREVDKTYMAIVRGVMELDEGVIDLPLSPVTQGLHLLMEVRDAGEGSIARTRYRVMERSASHTKVLLEPETGRQHQLRVHLSSIGYPIVGDKLYGPEREAPFLEIIETGLTPSLRARLGHDRQALHAYEISFTHPTTRERTTLRAPFADDLVLLWDQCLGFGAPP